MKQKWFLVACLSLGLFACTPTKEETPDSSTSIDETVSSSESVALEESDERVKNIYDEISWSFNVSEPEEIFKNADAVAVVRVTSVDESGIFDEESGSPTPYTPFQVTITEVLKGEIEVGEATLNQWGGKVTMRQEAERNDDEANKTLGWDDLTEAELDETYAEHHSEIFFDFVPGEEYIVALIRDEEDGTLFLGASGYNVFVTRENGTVLKNVLTNKKIDFATAENFF